MAAEEGVVEGVVEVVEGEVMAEGAPMDAEDAAVKCTIGTEEITEVAIATGTAGATRTTALIVAAETTMVAEEGGTTLEARGTETMNGDSN
mmetsp:Transcript_19450/g.45587  ORF Transcript_19450/g.45587 Transcript_19450/m.45587 type:complete len:91 (+) Transcript_19450:1184-1456(+)